MLAAQIPALVSTSVRASLCQIGNSNSLVPVFDRLRVRAGLALWVGMIAAIATGAGWTQSRRRRCPEGLDATFEHHHDHGYLRTRDSTGNARHMRTLSRILRKRRREPCGRMIRHQYRPALMPYPSAMTLLLTLVQKDWLNVPRMTQWLPHGQQTYSTA